MRDKYKTWEDTSQEGFCEVTLSGSKQIQDKRVQVLTRLAKAYRISDPETYLLLMNTATQIADQLYFPGE